MVGGGITGVGVALDAAARGMQVTLVERPRPGPRDQPLGSKLIRRAALPGDRTSTSPRERERTPPADHEDRAAPDPRLPTLDPQLRRRRPLKISIYAGARR